MSDVAGAVWGSEERQRLVGLCAWISGNRDAAEDLAQETLLEAWRNRHKLTDPSGADRWLSAVARNVCLRFAGRGERREVPLADLPEGSFEVELGREALVELLDGALELLAPAARDVLIERYVLDRSPAQIAARLGISDDAVSMRLSRGKLALRRMLSEAEWRPTGVWCVTCGTRRLLTRRERDGSAVAFRCPACDPAGYTALFPLDNPVFAALVGTLERPSAMFGRVGDWALGYWAGGDGTPAACTRCAAPVTVRAHTRTDTPRPIRGLAVGCGRCGEELWSSLVGLAMATTEVRALRRRAPRTHAEEHVTADRLVVAFGEQRVFFDPRTFALRHE